MSNSVYGSTDSGKPLVFSGSTDALMQLLNTGGVTKITKPQVTPPGVFVLPNGKKIKVTRIKKVAKPLPVAPAFDVLKDHREAADKFPKKTHEYTQDLTSFLVGTVAPYESAVSTAISDAGEVLRAITGSPGLEMSFGRAEVLLKSRLPELAVVQWAIDKLGLAEDIRKLVLQSYFESNKPVEIKGVTRG